MSKQDPISTFIFFRTQSEILLQKLLNAKENIIPEELQESQVLVLMVVDREFGSNQSQIAERLFITKQSVGVTIEFLIQKKYLMRTKDPVDGRAYLIKLTDKAWKLIEQIKSQFKEEMENWKLKLGSKNYKRLMSVIKEFNNSEIN